MLIPISKYLAEQNLIFWVDTEYKYYPSLKYHTKEFAIRFWLSALRWLKYTTDLPCSE